MLKRIPHKSLALLLFIVAFVQFSNTLVNDFAWDDKIVIQENERVQKGISGIPDLFVKYASELRQDKYGYRPITLVTFAIDYSLFQESPAGFHFMNVLYFSLLCMILFIVLADVFRNYSILLAFIAACLFIVHPIHVEVVANIKSRDEILAMLFGLLALHQFLKYYRNGGMKHLIFGPIFLLLGFLSRENAIVFLAIVPMVLLISDKINWKRLLVPFAIIPAVGVICIFILRYAMTSTTGVEQTADLNVFQESNELGNSYFFIQHFGIKLANAFHLITLYLKDFLFPYPLTFYSGSNHIPVLELHWKPIVGACFTIGLLVVSLVRFRKSPLLATGFFIFLPSIFVYLHLIRALADTKADRFMFLPSLGLILILLSILVKLFNHYDWSRKEETKLTALIRPMSPTFKGTIAVILLAFMVLTFQRNTVWKDDLTLVSNDLPHLDDCARAHYYYASTLAEANSNGVMKASVKASIIEHYIRSIELSDSIYYGRIELGSLYFENDMLHEAKEVYEQAVNIFPKASDPRFYLGQTYVHLQEYHKAIVQLKKSIELAPGYSDAYYLLSYAQNGAKRLDDAEATALDGLAKFPDQALQFEELLGQIYFDKGDLAQSTEHALKSISYGANAHTTYAAIIGRYQSVNQHEQADYYYQEALRKGIMQPVQ